MSTSPTQAFRDRLAAGPPLLLDAAMGTDLDRRGVTTTLPLWSALGLTERPDVVRAIHLDNLRAGADLITTNTFRTIPRTLAAAGLDPAQADRLTRLAVQIAHEARAEAGRPAALVAGSLAPLEDCYSPGLAPEFGVALAEHRAQVSRLAAAGVDLLLVETMPTATEAEAAVIAARETGLAATVGFVCELGEPSLPGGERHVRLLSGETLAVAVARVLPHRPAAILVNCAAAPVVAAALVELSRLTDLPTGGYANVGVVDPITGWAADPSVTPARYAEAAGEWLRLGARLIGGCCGTTPAHTAALRRLIDRRHRPAA